MTSFEAAAYDLVTAFNMACQQSQRAILENLRFFPDLPGMSLTSGAATLAAGIGAMNATTTANDHGPDRFLIEAAGAFEAAAHGVLQAVTDGDQDAQHAIYRTYQSLDLPDVDELGATFLAAALAQTINNLTQTDAVGLTIDLSGAQNSSTPEHPRNSLATARETRTDIAIGNHRGAHVAYYDFLQGLPLIVGPFVDSDTARQYIEGDNVDGDLYDRAWVQPITAPETEALYPLAKRPGQCLAFGCDRPGTTRIEREGAFTLLCEPCSELFG